MTNKKDNKDVNEVNENNFLQLKDAMKENANIAAQALSASTNASAMKMDQLGKEIEATRYEAEADSRASKKDNDAALKEVNEFNKN